MTKKYIYQEGNLCGHNWLLTTLIKISSSINQSSEAYNDVKYGCGYATDHIFYQQNGILKTENNCDNSHYFILNKNNNSSLDFNGYKYIAIEYEIEGDDSQIANCEVTINGEYIINSNQNTNRTITKIEITQDREYSYDPTIIIGTSNIKSEDYETKKLKIYNIWLETESNILYNWTNGFINKLINRIKQELSKKVDKEEGKGLSTEDFTTFYKEKLDNLEAISAQIVDVLPETGDKNCYYFVPDNQSEGTNNDFYVTFMYFETLGWKTIGTTKIDLKDYVTFAYLWENNYTKIEADDKFQTKIQILTQEEYDALVTAGTVDTNTTYLIKTDL